MRLASTRFPRTAARAAVVLAAVAFAAPSVAAAKDEVRLDGHGPSAAAIGGYARIGVGFLAYADRQLDPGGLLRVDFGVRLDAGFLGVSATGAMMGEYADISRDRPFLGFHGCLEGGWRGPWAPFVFEVGARACYVAVQMFLEDRVLTSDLVHGGSGGGFVALGGTIAELDDGVALDLVLRFDAALARLDFPSRGMELHLAVWPALVIRR